MGNPLLASDDGVAPVDAGNMLAARWPKAAAYLQTLSQAVTDPNAHNDFIGQARPSTSIRKTIQ